MASMFAFRRPADEDLGALLEDCRERPFNHPAAAAASLRKTPRGFIVDEYGADLGSGEDVFARACDELVKFSMYPPSWTFVYAEESPMVVGNVYVSLTKQLGMWAILPGRVIEVEDEATTLDSRKSFAFGTLRGHPKCGVERFRVRWCKETDRVRLEVKAVSRPIGITWLGKPIARHFQRQFHREAGPAFLAAVPRSTRR